MAESCCTTLLVAPMKNDMPVWVASSADAQRVRNYVANGNHLILTGGSLVSLEFLNRYFYYNIEPVTSEIMGATVRTSTPISLAVTPASLPSLPG